MNSDPNKIYLGDSVYAHFDGYAITVYLDNGLGQHHPIYLEPDVIDKLFKFSEKVRGN